jgi:catechol 2,3-dioxygenase-like lactoylglutathione lyase family enzyme
MLGNTDAVANIAVKNIEAARTFYEGTLALKKIGEQGSEVIVYKSGNTTINVYRSEFAGTNKATSVTWALGDQLESVVSALKAKGVKFEHYDVPGITREGDVHVAGDAKIAWFKDPDGNILGIAGR